jgi:hypothetical protein
MLNHSLFGVFGFPLRKGFLTMSSEEGCSHTTKAAKLSRQKPYLLTRQPPSYGGWGWLFIA